MFLEVYGDDALTDKSRGEWFRSFKNDNFGARSGQPKKFECNNLADLLDEGPSQMQSAGMI